MPFVVARRMGVKGALKKHPEAMVIDLTSKGELPWKKFSPFYPHGRIPIPLSPGATAWSVEGIWQALKVFEHEEVDRSKLTITTMKGIKRSVTKHSGKVRGHQAGLFSKESLGYIEARWQIYLPAYRWVLDHKLQDEVARLRTLGQERMVILLDYETNEDVNDPSAPLSHAGLVKRYLEDDWPTEEEKR